MNEIQEYLKGMGNTAEEVALFLEKEGIKGEPTCPFTCPIAILIEKKFNKNVFVYAYGIRCLGMTIEVPMPVTYFILKFDTRHFPQLKA